MQVIKQGYWLFQHYSLVSLDNEEKVNLNFWQLSNILKSENQSTFVKFMLELN